MMMHGDTPKATVKLMAAKAKEAAGLLKLIGPLCNRARQLTEAEADILVTTVQNANALLREAMDALYAKCREEPAPVAQPVKPARKNMVARDGNGRDPGGLYS